MLQIHRLNFRNFKMGVNYIEYFSIIQFSYHVFLLKNSALILSKRIGDVSFFRRRKGEGEGKGREGKGRGRNYDTLPIFSHPSNYHTILLDI